MGTRATQIIDVPAEEVIRDLNAAYADEWLAFYAYTYMAQVVSGRPAARHVAEALREIAKEELEHQDELAERITQLGGVPERDPANLGGRSNAGYPMPPEDPTDLDAVIRTVIEAERGAIDVYNKLARKYQGKDPLTYELVVHILAEEVDHEDDFETIIK